MNNKAFTLIELLGVLILLSVIAILVFPTVRDIIYQGENTVYQAQINNILKSTYDFSLKNISNLPHRGEKKYVTLGELKYLGLIDINLTDPITLEKFPDNLVISISNVSTNYEFDRSISRLEGNYLYKIEFDKLSETTLAPIITLSDLEKNSNNNYIMLLNLNENIGDVNYTAVSSKNINITDKVKMYITKNDIAVDRIDSSTSSIYKINYVVVDDEGYSNMAVLNVIIADTEKPTITLPSNNKIRTNVSSINLLEGVKCTDNSGFCDITITGDEDIQYGVAGKYIVEYTGIDPSGNTVTVRRVITIE